MENLILATIPEDIASKIFLISAVAYLVCCFPIVVRVKNLGNKLILLGLLTATAGLVFAASMESVKALAWLMVLGAFFLVFYGATKYNQ